MVEIHPLCGLRYGQAYNCPEAYAPPYDVIDSAGRARLVASDLHNVVRIDLAPKPASPAWYTEAAATLSEWRRDGVLMRDELPAYYGYEQHFSMGGGPTYVRRGFFAAVRLAEWGQGIYRHERTRLGPRADRLNLMRATQAQLSPVFGMVPDPHGELQQWLQAPAETAVDFTDSDGVRQIMWPITDTAVVNALTQWMAARNIVIADGHHRYETALSYRAERRAAEGDPAGHRPYDDVLMYLTAADDPGLVILPCHRVVAGCESFDGRQLLTRLALDFVVQPCADAALLSAAIADRGDAPMALGLYMGRWGAWVLRLRSASRALEAAGTDVPADIAELDVSVLQNLILSPHLGLDADVMARTERVRYTIEAEQARAWVDAGESQAAFILNPTTTDQVQRAALNLVTMPQKSTYFYPKLLTGLVINPLDGA